MNAPDFAQRLVQALGPDTVLTAPDDIAPWLSDWRGLYNGRAQAVVRPRRTEDVAQCLALCQQAGVPVVPRGGPASRRSGYSCAAAMALSPPAAARSRRRMPGGTTAGRRSGEP